MEPEKCLLVREVLDFNEDHNGSVRRYESLEVQIIWPYEPAHELGSMYGAWHLSDRPRQLPERQFVKEDENV